MTHLLLENRQAPGDLLVMSAAVRALHFTRPGEFTTSVSSTSPAVWKNNPHVVPPAANGRHYRIGYTPGISRSNQTSGHFAHAFTTELASKLGIDLALPDLRPHVVLAQDEGPVCGLEPNSYWVVMAGGKRDFTAKLWGYARWQAVVDATPGISWVQAGATGPRALQKPMQNVTDLLGRTGFREFLRLVAFSRGVACQVTCGMHAAAAFNKPCVVVAGGREPWWWEAYTRATWRRNCCTEPPADFVPHTYIHTMGQLPCCRHHGCWKAGLGEKLDNNCTDVVKGVERVPHCMQLISPDTVVEAIENYERGVLPPDIELPTWLKPPIARYNVTAGVARPRVHPGPQPIRRAPPRPMAQAFEPAAADRREVQPPPVMRLADVMGGVQLKRLEPLRVIIEPVPGFEAGWQAVTAAVRQYTPAAIAETPASVGWTIWLAQGVRPTAPGWVYPIAQAVKQGATLVAGTGDGWLAASAEAAAGLKGAGWRTLLGKATRVRGVRMATETPGVYV